MVRRRTDSIKWLFLLRGSRFIPVTIFYAWLLFLSDIIIFSTLFFIYPDKYALNRLAKIDFWPIPTFSTMHLLRGEAALFAKITIQYYPERVESGFRVVISHVRRR